MKNAMQRLNEIVNEKGPLIASVNPELKEIYRLWKATKKNFVMPLEVAQQQEVYAECYMQLCRQYLEILKDKVGAVKISNSCYELCGQEKMCWELAQYAKELGFFVIGDFNKAEVGASSFSYAKVYLSKESPFDCITINPYFGTDGVMPFLDVAKENGKGIFVIVKTPNPSSWEIQDVELADGRPFYELVAGLVTKWGQYTEPCNQENYNLVGAVVGTKSFKQAERLRKLMPNTMFLVPEYGIEIVTPKDLVAKFDSKGCGAAVNSSKIMMSYKEESWNTVYTEAQWADAAEVELMREQSELERAIEYYLFEK